MYSLKKILFLWVIKILNISVLFILATRSKSEQIYKVCPERNAIMFIKIEIFNISLQTFNILQSTLTGHAHSFAREFYFHDVHSKTLWWDSFRAFFTPISIISAVLQGQSDSRTQENRSVRDRSRL